MGIEQHGQDPTKAAVKAVKDAVSRVCIPYFLEKGKEFAVYVEIGVPHSSQVRREEILKALPGGECYKVLGIEVKEGGLATKCVRIEELGDKKDEMIIAVAAITVLVREQL